MGMNYMKLNDRIMVRHVTYLSDNYGGIEQRSLEPTFMWGHIADLGLKTTGSQPQIKVSFRDGVTTLSAGDELCCHNRWFSVCGATHKDDKHAGYVFVYAKAKEEQRDRGREQ